MYKTKRVQFNMHNIFAIGTGSYDKSKHNISLSNSHDRIRASVTIFGVRNLFNYGH